MALSQITDEIWIGSLMALRAEKTLGDAGVTHVLSVLGPDLLNLDSQMYKSLPLIQQVKKHLSINIEDVDDANIIDSFAETNSFIQDAIDSGGGVLVHCAAGISRSVTCVCAFLMKTRKWRPDAAIEFVQSRRAIANPNEGFRRQLQVYYDCGYKVSDDAKPYRDWKLRNTSSLRASQTSGMTSGESPVFTPVDAPPLTIAWRHVLPAIIKRSGKIELNAKDVQQVYVDGCVHATTEAVADSFKGKPPTNLKLQFSDFSVDINEGILTDVLKHVVTKMVSLRCKGCSTILASSASIDRHVVGNEGTCQHYFLEPVEWMRPELEKGSLEGRLSCPKCSRKVGSYLWQGSRCSCGTWVTPSIKLSKAKIDEMTTLARPLL